MLQRFKKWLNFKFMLQRLKKWLNFKFMLQCFKKVLKLKVYVIEKWQFLKTNIMFRFYRRFVFFKNFTVIVYSLVTGDLSVLIYSLGVDLDTFLGRPQTWLQAIAKAKEEVADLAGKEVDETKWEKAKRFIYDYRWYFIGTLFVLGVASIWIFTGGVTGSPPLQDNSGTTITEDALPKAPLVLSETNLIMDQFWLQRHIDDLSHLKEGTIIFEEELPANLPPQILDINKLNETSSILLTPISLTPDITVPQILTRDALGNVMSYYILPVPHSFQENPLITEITADALTQMNSRMIAEGLLPFDDATFVAIVDPQSNRGTLFLEYSSMSNIRWHYVPLKT